MSSVFSFKQKTAYEMRISDWSSDVCSSDLTIEEAYEVSDAIAGGDPAAIRDELGDLLLQVVFHSQIATDDGLFGFDDVANAISDKMERRHPHIFGNEIGRTSCRERVCQYV